jgi:hypothetical protein
MFRPALVITMSLAVFGTLAGYSRFLATLPERQRALVEPPPANGRFSLEVTRSFEAAVDAFAFADDPALVVRLAGRDVVRRTDVVDASEPIHVDDLTGIVAGKNAFFVRAIPSDSFVRHPCALQLRVLRDGRLIAEETLWSTPGDIVAGELRLDLGSEVGGEQ